MENTQKASISTKVKNLNIVFICFVGIICVLGFVMTILSLIKLKFVFVAAYLLAVLLGFSYVVIKINTIIPTYIERNNDVLNIQNWENGVFPFVIDKGFFGEFIPSKTKVETVEIKSISKIYIGSKNYLFRLISEGEFFDFINDIYNRYENTIKHMDILYIKTVDENEIFMSVTDFDEDELVEIFKPIIDENKKIDFKCGLRYVSKAIPTHKSTIKI